MFRGQRTHHTPLATLWLCLIETECELTKGSHDRVTVKWSLWVRMGGLGLLWLGPNADR